MTDLKSDTIKLFVLFSVLFLATILSDLIVGRYTPIGDNLLQNPTFADALKHWKTNGKVEIHKSHAVLSNASEVETGYLRQDFPVSDLSPLFLMQVTLSAHSVIPGEKPWESLRLYLVGGKRDGILLWRHPHAVKEIHTNIKQRTFSKVLQPSPEATSLTAGVEFLHALGRAEISKISVVPVTERSQFKLIRLGLVGLWAAFILGPVRIQIRKTNFSLPTPVRFLSFIYFCLILAVLLIPSPYLAEVGVKILQTLIAEGLPFSDLTSILSLGIIKGDKIIHFAIFAPLAGALSFYLRTPTSENILRLLFFLTAFVFLAEALQTLTFGREIEFLDITSGIFGVLFGIVLGRLTKNRLKRF